MADHPGYLKNYDQFYDRLMAKFDEMAEVAYEKRNWENLSLPSSIPFWGKDLGEPNIGEAQDRLAQYAANHLSGDYDDLEALKRSVASAQLQLTGTSSENEYSPPADSPLSGINEERGKIYTGLDSWTNETGNIFRRKYVNSIDVRTTNQNNSLAKSINAITAAQELLINSRKVALRLPDESKQALEDYSPMTDALIGTAKVTFSAIGCVVAPVKAALIVVTLEVLPPESELTVSKLMDSLMSAIESAEKEKKKGENITRSKLQEFLNEEADDWSSFVCARPESQG